MNRREFKRLCNKVKNNIPSIGYREYQRNHLYSIGWDVFHLKHEEIEQVYLETFGKIYYKNE